MFYLFLFLIRREEDVKNLNFCNDSEVSLFAPVWYVEENLYSHTLLRYCVISFAKIYVKFSWTSTPFLLFLLFLSWISEKGPHPKVKFSLLRSQSVCTSVVCTIFVKNWHHIPQKCLYKLKFYLFVFSFVFCNNNVIWCLCANNFNILHTNYKSHDFH